MLTLGALGTIWVFVTITLRSLFLSSVSMLNIGLSVPMGLVIYALIFRIPYFCILHVLVILIALGIGADNTFLYHESWKSAR